MVGKLMNMFNTAAGKALAEEQLALLIEKKALKVLRVDWEEKAAYVSFDVDIAKGRIIGKAWVLGSMFNTLKEIGGLDGYGGADEEGGSGEAGAEAEGEEGAKEAGANGEPGDGAGDAGHTPSDAAEGGGDGKGGEQGNPAETPDDEPATDGGK